MTKKEIYKQILIREMMAVDGLDVSRETSTIGNGSFSRLCRQFSIYQLD
jgi:hypothetical protein